MHYYGIVFVVIIIKASEAGDLVVSVLIGNKLARAAVSVIVETKIYFTLSVVLKTN